MASSAFPHRPFKLRENLWVIQHDIRNNRTQVGWEAWIDKTNTSPTWSNNPNSGWEYQIDGVTLGSASNLRFDFRGAGPWKIGGGTTWISHAANGSKSISIGLYATYEILGHTSVVVNGLGLPTIPRVPTRLSVTRVSDTQHTLNWTRTSTYSSVTVHRRTNGGPWQQIGVAAGNAASFSDTSTVGNRRYEWRVLGNAAAGQSAPSASVVAYTTPAAPTGVVATRSGDNIVVTAASVPPYATTFNILDGGTVVATGVSLPWTHVAPDASVPHTYTVAGRVGSLVGVYSAASNTVQLISPPNAPGTLTPNGGVVAAGEPVSLRWAHNPVDSSPQTSSQVRFRLSPSDEWTQAQEHHSADQFLEITAPTGGTRYEWQARTRGQHADYSPWSVTAVFDSVDRPGVAVTTPEEDWDASSLTVQWSWLQAQERPQSVWEMELSQDGAVVETRTGTGAATAVPLNTRLTPGSWVVRVRAGTGNVWSMWATQAFEVVFDPPAVPSILGVWDEAQGAVTLTAEPGDTPGVPETVAVLIERSVDGGARWEIVTTITESVSIVDWESLSYGGNEYRATASTSEGATATAMVTVTATSGAIWLSGGVGYSVACRLPFDPVMKITAGRERVRKQYAGRSAPVALTGEALSLVVEVSGTTTDRDPETADIAQLVRLAQLDTDLFLFRDPDGRRIYGSIDKIPTDRKSSTLHPDGWEGLWGYSFTLTEATR